MKAEDAVALRDLVDRYADAVDRRDARALRSVFADDGALWVQADGGPVENEWKGAGVEGSWARWRATPAPSTWWAVVCSKPTAMTLPAGSSAWPITTSGRPADLSIS